jgi:UDPglucose 6-dehydrogenase
VREIAPLLSPTAIVITKSTVPVGTGDEIERILREERPDAEMQVVSNPEFLREGAAIYDFKHPDRIVIGSDDERARAVLAEPIGRFISMQRRCSMSTDVRPR